MNAIGLSRVVAVAVSAALGIGCLAPQEANAASFTLDFDSSATGADIVADGFLVTPLGTITLFEPTPGDASISGFGTFPADLPFGTFGDRLVEAGSIDEIGLDFDFDVSEITFNFGGDGGGFSAWVIDSGGVILDSIYTADLPGSGLAPGPHTFTAAGIRGLRFEDPVAGAALDDIEITPVPEPGAVTLFGLGLAGLGAVRRRRRTHTQA